MQLIQPVGCIVIKEKQTLSKMNKRFIALLFIVPFALLSMGFADFGSPHYLGTSQLLSAVYICIFTGLAGVGLVDLVNRNESVSHH